MPHVSVGGRRLYYESHGDAPGVPLLLVMGLGGSCRGWLPIQVPELSKRRRVVIFDNRGVAGSEDPGGPFTVADLAGDTAGLLEALAIERADVLGVFLGGMIAQELALRHPARVDRLVLVGTFAHADAKRRMLLEKWRGLAEIGAPLDLMIKARLVWTLQDETLEQTDLIQQMIDFFERDGAPLSNDLFMRQCDACLGHDTRDRLGDIKHRTLVVCGRHDQLTPPRLHRELADAIPDAHLVTLHNGGHLVMVENAERFHHVVEQFLEDER